jgi:tetratricopeptide (TPR) repeat protein
MRVLSHLRAAVLVASLVAIAATTPAGDGAPSPAPDAEVAEATRRSRELCGAADFAAAAELLKETSKRLGASAALTCEEGRVYYLRARHEDANGTDGMLVEALYADATIRAKRALELDPDHAEAVLLLADALDAGGDGEGALAALTAWTVRRPKDAGVRIALGDRLFAARDWSAADLQYTKALEIAPENGVARLNQTVARQWLRVPLATLEKGYLEAVRLLPDQDRPIALLLGLHPRDRAKRLELLDQIVAANPKAVWARVWIAHVCRNEEPVDTKRALAVLREAEAIAPGNADVHFHVAQMIEDAGDLAATVLEYTLAVENGAPGAMATASDALDRLLHTAPGNAEIPLADRERAYDAVCAKNPAVGRYGNNAGFWFRDVGRDYEKSLKYYLASVKAAPDDQDFLNDTALIYLFHLPDRKEACLPMFEKVLRLVERDGQPPVRGYWDALENLCKYWFEKGEFRKTIEYADKRKSPKATLNGRPYPSFVAMQWRARAERELAKAK